MTEIEKEAEREVDKRPVINPFSWKMGYIAGRTKSEEEIKALKEWKEEATKRIIDTTQAAAILDEKLKSIRNSTIEQCLTECELLADDGIFYWHITKKKLNALKTPD